GPTVTASDTPEISRGGVPDISRRDNRAGDSRSAGLPRRVTAIASPGLRYGNGITESRVRRTFATRRSAARARRRKGKRPRIGFLRTFRAGEWRRWRAAARSRRRQPTGQAEAAERQAVVSPAGAGGNSRPRRHRRHGRRRVVVAAFAALHVDR